MANIVKNSQFTGDKTMEIEITDTHDMHLGHLILRHDGVEWGAAQTKPGSGKKYSWQQFAALMRDQL